LFRGAPECNLHDKPRFDHGGGKHARNGHDDHQCFLGDEPAVDPSFSAGNGYTGLPRRRSVSELCSAAAPSREDVVDATWFCARPSWDHRIHGLRRRFRRQYRRWYLHPHGDRDLRLAHEYGYLQPDGAIDGALCAQGLLEYDEAWLSTLTSAPFPARTTINGFNSGKGTTPSTAAPVRHRSLRK
jgi:hypothetical protein